ncbi:MAG: YdcF family protein [Bradyrhizobium sp.]
MTTSSRDKSPNVPFPARPSRWGRTIVAALGVALVAAVGSFVAFVSQLRNVEIRPERKADAIVVLTGGAPRLPDALRLLAAGYGKRLLISGVHPSSAARDISRALSENQSYFDCCVDLDHSSFNTHSNAVQTRIWAHAGGFRSLIVVTSNYHMPRAMVELSHAMPDIELIPFAVVSESWRDEPWWSNGESSRLVLSEYVKYVVAELRVHLADLGVHLNFDFPRQPAREPPRRPTTAQAG